MMPPSSLKPLTSLREKQTLFLFCAIMKLFTQRPTGLGKLLKEDDEVDKERYKLQEAESQEQIERMDFYQLLKKKI